MRAAAAESERAPFPWDAVLSLGLGVLRLSPKNFWSMTPLEFAHAAGLIAAREALPTRGGLDALMRQYPDGG